jgi:hypothetical protein
MASSVLRWVELGPSKSLERLTLLSRAKQVWVSLLPALGLVLCAGLVRG